MPIIEIARKTGWNTLDHRGNLHAIVERTRLQIPDTDGVYKTELGSLALEVLERRSDGDLQKIALEGDVLRGTPLKRRHNRTSRKIVNIGRYGKGEQTLSKREVLIVRL